MGMTPSRHSRKAFQSTGLHRYCERAGIKIKCLHGGSKTTGKMARACRVLLSMERVLYSKLRASVFSSSVRAADRSVRPVTDTVAGKALP